MDSIVNLLVISVYYWMQDLILKLFLGGNYVFCGICTRFLGFLWAFSSELISTVCIKMIGVFSFTLICYSCTKS